MNKCLDSFLGKVVLQLIPLTTLYNVQMPATLIAIDGDLGFFEIDTLF